MDRSCRIIHVGELVALTFLSCVAIFKHLRMLTRAQLRGEGAQRIRVGHLQPLRAGLHRKPYASPQPCCSHTPLLSRPSARLARFQHSDSYAHSNMAPDTSNDRWRPKERPGLLRGTIGPALLLVVCPIAVNSIALCVKSMGGSLHALFTAITAGQFGGFLLEAFPFPTAASVVFLGGLLVLQLALLVLVPGEQFSGPRAPSGHVPLYTDNGFQAFFWTLAVLTVACWQGLLAPTLIYDELLPIMSTLNAAALAASLLLYAKGLRSPSTADAGSSGSVLMDLYWGTELYPRVFGVDLKQLLIARFGIVLWCLFALSFACKSAELAGGRVPNDQLVSALLMVVYIVKFFYWERWYMHAADIQVDRFGFMMCWGPIAFMPLVHTLQNLFLVGNPGLGLSNAAAVGYLLLGNVMTLLNYDSDTQRHRVRSSDGKCLVWGRPATVIRATYSTSDGKAHRALLSVCGYQALSRHFHYLPDIVNLFLYCSPAGFGRVLPYLYFLYLTALLLDRTYRIDKRCHAKYGTHWEEYCRRVPQRLIPGVW